MPFFKRLVLVLLFLSTVLLVGCASTDVDNAKRNLNKADRWVRDNMW